MASLRWPHWPLSVPKIGPCPPPSIDFGRQFIVSWRSQRVAVDPRNCVHALHPRPQGVKIARRSTVTGSIRGPQPPPASVVGCQTSSCCPAFPARTACCISEREVVGGPELRGPSTGASRAGRRRHRREHAPPLERLFALHEEGDPSGALAAGAPRPAAGDQRAGVTSSSAGEFSAMPCT